MPRRSIWVRYGVTIAAVVLATLARSGLEPIVGLKVPFTIYFPAILLCAWFGGLGPGLVATVLGTVAAWYFFVPPQFSFRISDPSDAAELAIFLIAGIFTSLLAESLHTSRRKAEENESREREQRERFRTTLASVGDAVIATDPGGSVTFMNEVAQHLTGWTADNAEGLPLERVFNIVNEQTREQVANPALRAMKEGRIFGLANHTLLISKTGNEVPIDDSGAPIRDSAGSIIGAVLVFRDVSERRRAESDKALLAEIVESSEDAIISKNLDGKIEVWNGAAERMYGYSASEAIGQPITITVPPEKLEEEQMILERLRRGEDTDHFETVRMSKSGRRIDVSLTVSPVRDTTGRIIGASKIARDITERKRAEKAVSEQREWLRVTLSSIGDAVITTDTPGAITFLNDVAESLTGWRREEAEARPLQEVFRVVTENTREEVQNPALQAIEQGRVVGLANHSVLIARDGREVPIDDSGAPIKDADGRVIGAVLIFRDITARKQTEEERAEILAREKSAREHAEAASRAKDEFVAIVSHELRAPLNAIMGWAHLVESGNFGQAEVTRAIETIQRNARAQARLIDDLMDTSRMITGKLVLNVRPAEIGRIVESALDSIRSAAVAKSISVQLHLDPRSKWVLGDPARLEQIVWNLLSNAVKFTPALGRIEVRVERVDSRLQITVGDTGAGISPDFLPHVFERFRQAPTTTRRNHGGLGLGLAIVKDLVELHGGTVSADSPGEGLGASFTIRLPLSAVQLPADSVDADPAALPAASPASSAALTGLRVLVVDDDADTRELVMRILVAEGAEARSCASVAETLEAVEEWHPSVLVSDVSMPGEDGYALIGKLRELGPERGGDLPAVALTGYAGSEDRTRVLAAGFHIHVPKPVEVAELVTVVASLAGRLGKSRTSGINTQGGEPR